MSFTVLASNFFFAILRLVSKHVKHLSEHSSKTCIDQNAESKRPALMLTRKIEMALKFRT